MSRTAAGPKNRAAHRCDPRRGATKKLTETADPFDGGGRELAEGPMCAEVNNRRSGSGRGEKAENPARRRQKGKGQAHGHSGSYRARLDREKTRTVTTESHNVQ